MATPSCATQWADKSIIGAGVAKGVGVGVKVGRKWMVMVTPWFETQWVGKYL